MATKVMDGDLVVLGVGGAGDASGSAPGGAAMVAPDAPGMSSTGTNLLSTTPRPNGGLGSAVLSGYQAAVDIADYFKNI